MRRQSTLEKARAKLLAYRTGRTEDGTEHPVRSLRHLAPEVGMSPTGLSQFIAGTWTRPYWKTMYKLGEWYKAEVARSGTGK
jgi:hypothetical protein